MASHPKAEGPTVVSTTLEDLEILGNVRICPELREAFDSGK